jgi:hypothetical protein
VPYWQDHDLFGPSRSMHRPKLQWVRRSLRKHYRARRGDLKYNRAKWMWWPRHVLNRRAPVKTQIRNDHFMAQLDRCVQLIRPPHKRRPAR